MTKHFYQSVEKSRLRQQATAGMDAGTVWIGYEREQTVCFTGHRHIAAAEKAQIDERLDFLLASLADEGKCCFLCGGAIGFDTMAAEAVLRLKKARPEICLCLAIPCENQAQRWPQADRDRWQELREQADLAIVLSPIYFNGCMQIRNRFMVNHASLTICYLKHARGGTMATAAYALKTGVPLINLSDCSTLSGHE